MKNKNRIEITATCQPPYKHTLGILIGKRFDFSDNKAYEFKDALKVAKIISQELKLPIYIIGEDDRTPVLFEPKKRKKHNNPSKELTKALNHLLPEYEG